MTHFTALRIAVVLVCTLAIRESYVRMRADRLFRADTPRSIRRAIELTPDQPRYYFRLAQLDEAHAVDLLETALRLAPFSAAAAIELGLRAESTGDHSRAEKLLLRAFDVDRTYVPRWTLANFYFRRDNLPAFWIWVRRAAEMPADDIGALLDLCWRVTPDGEQLARAVPAGDPSTARQLLAFLLAEKEWSAAAVVARQLIDRGDPRVDRSLLLSLTDRLISGNHPVPAGALWRLLADRQWIADDPSWPNNPDFARAPLPVAFDWLFQAASGVNISAGPSGLEVEFSGKQPEVCPITEQIVLLSAGQYEFVSKYRTSGLTRESGLSWSISPLRSDILLAKSPALANEKFIEQKIRFSVEGQYSLVRLQLEYRRPMGTPRISGNLVVHSTAIRTVAAHDLSKMR